MTSQASERASHLGPFPNDDGSIEDLDALLAFALPRQDMEDARALMQSKWWDYRFVHPGHCLMRFHHLYAEAMERWRPMFGVTFSRSYDTPKLLDHPIWYREREWVRGSVVKKREVALHPPGITTSLWRSMCIADANGIPHDRWIEWAFSYAREAGWQHRPRPNMLAVIQITKHAIDQWAAEQADLMNMPKDPMFLAQNYAGHPCQNAFQDWLIGEIGKRSRPELALAHYLFKEPFVVSTLAADALGEDVFRRARRLL